MEAKIRALIFDYAGRKNGAAPYVITLRSTDPWDVLIKFGLPGSGLFEIRNVRADDLETFRAFSDGLSAASREAFRPYPWDSQDRLLPALHMAISQAVSLSTGFKRILCWLSRVSNP